MEAVVQSWDRENLIQAPRDAAHGRAVLDGLDAGVRAQGGGLVIGSVDDEALEAREAEVVEDRVLAVVGRDGRAVVLVGELDDVLARGYFIFEVGVPRLGLGGG